MGKSKFGNNANARFYLHGSNIAFVIGIVFSGCILVVLSAVNVITFVQAFVFAICFFSLFMAATRNDKLISVIIVLMLVPLSFGHFFNLKIVWAAEPIIFIALLFTLYRNIFLDQDDSLMSYKNNPVLIWLLIYFIVLLYNYIRFPLPPSSLVGIVEEGGGIRFYYDKFLIIAVMFIIADVVKRDVKYREKITNALLVSVCMITFLGVLTIFVNPIYDLILILQENKIFANDSILSGLWRKVVDPFTGATRSYILWAAPFGFLLLMTNMVRIKPFVKIILLTFLSIGLMLSATRNFILGVTIGFLTWILLTGRKKLIFPAIMMIFFFFVVINMGLFTSHANRVFTVASDLNIVTSNRLQLFEQYWSSFAQNILFGVGVGATEIGNRVPGTPEYFIAQNLRFGGHGFFLGTLYTQGILGLIPFILICLATIRISMRLLKSSDQEGRIIGQFTIVYLVYSFVPFLVGGTETYNQLFVVLGLLIGTYIRICTPKIRNG